MWGNKKEYQLIITIVDQGKGEEVIECSKLVGAEGGTILTGRGAGKETAKILGILIEPEKDVVLTLVEKTKADSVFVAIVQGMELEEPGKGIAFVIDVPKVAGIVNTEE
jgi:nitrogen regulatory protein PII